MADGVVEGVTHDRYAAVRDVFEANLASGADLGASFCATVEGETVVDLWGGWADPAKTRPWTRDTIVNVYSTTKTMTALVALLVADRGDLDFDAPVARYWPEFAAGGKAEVKVSHLMSHSAGLSGWQEPITREDLYDWEKMTRLLAAQTPFWAPGTAPGYHALTQGYLVGEVIRRITGKSLGTVFREEIAEPLGADFWIGLPASEDGRVAELVPPAPGTTQAEVRGQTEIQRNMANNPGIHVDETKTRAWRGAEIPAAGGTGNARSVAQVHAILANGGVAQGRRFLSEAGCRKALELQIEGEDLCLAGPARFGLGFGLAGGVVPLPNPNAMYWGGYGGSLIIIDMDARTTFAYAMNRMVGTTQGDTRAFGLAMAMWAALGIG
ncbi:serine hydrolase domain-containing protein [Phenylobacterium sp. SCN 70-31]|uniref:serine hydrolase domain-containing protein n=1 Tax=Phenylobacterium sp. SCN 70-31 TaxID=1660129 RepID=UPI000869A1DD|nr:serine hydrolase domain-containing protein [Phenylobacterium sp. SCN 70-31]ODT87912.1 MAG: serine hydrolase [Phenylobacterium sp. SCN 70-31]